MADPIDELIEPNKFWVAKPVWVLFDSDAVLPSGSIPSTAVITQRLTISKLVFAPLFTDWDLALRYINDDLSRACAMPFGRDRLEVLLTELHRRKLRHVSFDPRGNDVRTNPITEVLAGIRSARGG